MAKKATRILIEFDDGTYSESSNSSDAAQIYEWVVGCETMAYNHGSKYCGPTLQSHPMPPPSENRNLVPGTKKE